MTPDAQPFPYLQLARTDTRERDGQVVQAVPGAPAGADDGRGDAVEGSSCAGGDVIGAGDPPATSGHRLLVDLWVLDFIGTSVCWLAMSLALVHVRGPLDAVGDRLAPGLAATAVGLAVMWPVGLYRSRRCARRTEELARIAVVSLAAAGTFTLVQWLVAGPTPQALACAVVATAGLATMRWLFGRHVRSRRADGRYLRGVLIVGTNQDAVDLRMMLESEPALGFAVRGVIGERADDACWAGLPIGSSVAEIPRLAVATGAGGVIVVPYSLTSETTQQAIDVAAEAGLHVQLWPGLRGVGSRRLRSVPVSGEPFFYVEPHVPGRWQLVAKRALDVAGSAVGLVMAMPLLAVAATLVWLEDGGPVLHRGPRVGLHGAMFTSYKLRTMATRNVVDQADLAAINERTDGPLFKAANDPRVTRVGRLLRATSIDELPQLWNVLRGTMSLVGPRPALPSEVVDFDDALQRRHSVRPGLTGLWQVEARRNPSFRAYRRLDLSYVDNWSLMLDVTILLSTVPSVLSHAVGELRSRARR